MMDKIKVFIWKLYLSKEKLEERQKKLVAGKLYFYVKNTSPGGILPFTLWQKVKFFSLLLLLILFSLVFWLMIFFYPAHPSS